MKSYFLSNGKWRILYIPHNFFSLLSRDNGVDNYYIDRFVFDFNPTFISTLDAMVQKNGFEYLEKLGWRKTEFKVDDGIMEKLRERCFEGRIALAKRAGKLLFYDAISGLEFAQTE